MIQIICMGGLFYGLVELRSMQKATHSIQFVPAEDHFQKVTQDVKESLEKDIFDNVI